MKYRPRIYYTDSDKEMMWDRWQKGGQCGALLRCRFVISNSEISLETRLSQKSGDTNQYLD